MTKRRPGGIALVLLSASFFGAMALFAREAYDAGFDVTTLLSVRFVLAAVILGLLARANRGPALPRRTVLVALGLGAVGYAAQAGLYFGALERIDASLTSLLLYIYPVLVFVGALALGRERASAARIAALALALGGTVLVLLGGDVGGLDGLGVAMGIGAAVVYAGYILVADRALGTAEPLQLSALIAAGAAVTTTGAALVSGGPNLGAVAPRGWGWVAAVVLVSTIAAMLTFFRGMALVGPSSASILSTVEPVVTIALAMTFLGESLHLTQVAGGVLVLTAVVLVQRRGGTVISHDARAHAPAPAPARALARSTA